MLLRNIKRLHAVGLVCSGGAESVSPHGEAAPRGGNALFARRHVQVIAPPRRSAQKLLDFTPLNSPSRGARRPAQRWVRRRWAALSWARGGWRRRKRRLPRHRPIAPWHQRTAPHVGRRGSRRARGASPCYMLFGELGAMSAAFMTRIPLRTPSARRVPLSIVEKSA